MKSAITPIVIPGIGTATFFECSDHRTVSGKRAVPAVTADPSATPPIIARDAVPAKSGNVDSQIALYDSSGKQLSAGRARLTDDQFTAWDETVVDDSAYFVVCAAANAGVTLSTPPPYMA